MNYEKLNLFNEFCKTLPEYDKVKPSQIIIIWKSMTWKITWIGFIIGKILVKLGFKSKNENKLQRKATKP